MASVDVIKVISSVKPRALSIINHELDVGRHPSDAKGQRFGGASGFQAETNRG
jgi:hypothetical protein